MHNTGMDGLREEIAAAAARLVVEEGLELGPAKRLAVKQMGLAARTALPDNDAVLQQVQEYIAQFCADTQPTELLALRTLALQWMRRLQRFRPFVSGAVWNGTATRRSDIALQLFCDDPKSAEIELIDWGVRFQPSVVTGLNGQPVEALSMHVACPQLNEMVGLHLMVYDKDDLRGALVPDAQGRRLRGDTAALERLVHDHAL